MEILPYDQTIEVVKLYKKIDPEDFDGELFNNIVKANENISKNQTGNFGQSNKNAPTKGVYGMLSFPNLNTNVDLNEFNKDLKKKQKLMFKAQFEEMMSNTQVIDDLKNRNWKAMRDWLGDLNLFDITSVISLLENEKPVQAFEMILCLIFTEYQKGL